MSIYIDYPCLHCKHYIHDIFKAERCAALPKGFPKGWLGPPEYEKDTYICNNNIKWEKRTNEQIKNDNDLHKRYREICDKADEIARVECFKIYELNSDFPVFKGEMNQPEYFCHMYSSSNKNCIYGIFSCDLSLYKSSEIYDENYYQKIFNIGKIKFKVNTKDFSFSYSTFPYKML